MSDQAGSKTDIKILIARLDGLQALLDERSERLTDRDRQNDKFLEERDRRYSEVKSAEEKALKVKEQADRDALDLARQIQIYKDEKANELRSQINSERGLYVTRTDLSASVEKIEAMIEPLIKYVAAQRGEQGGVANSRNMVTWLIGIIGFILMFGGLVVTVAIYLAKGTR